MEAVDPMPRPNLSICTSPANSGYLAQIK